MEKRKTIIVNASASKTGGAKTIVDTYVEYLVENETLNRYVIISPHIYDTSNENLTFIKKSTSNLSTILFTLFFVRAYCKKYNADKIISFNNINVLFSSIDKVTYFHQLKLLKGEYKEFKLKIYSLIIKYFLKNSIFVVQSPYVRKLFVQKFSNAKIIVCWPGFSSPVHLELPDELKAELRSFKSKFGRVGLIPINYDARHKNIDLIVHNLNTFSKLNLGLVSLLSDPGRFKDSENLVCIGAISRPILFALYEVIDFIIYPSLDETIGLPIIEFLQTTKPAFVFEAEYAVGIYEELNKPKNFILFNQENLVQNLNNNINIKGDKVDYSIGAWHKL